MLKQAFQILIYAVVVSSLMVTAVKRETTTSILSVQTTAVTSCHMHGSDQFCFDGEGNEGSIIPAPTNTAEAPKSYTGCHSHDSDTYCVDSSGTEYQFLVEEVAGAGTETYTSVTSSSTASSGEENCHFHAGVEHCTGGESEHNAEVDTCERVDRDYNIPLRIGLLFVILVTSGIGSFGPILLTSFLKLNLDGIVITILKQFGTGIVISTAFVHLMTHAALIWGNSCITLSYESTGPAITMAGIFLTFFIEYLGSRLITSRNNKASNLATEREIMEKNNVTTEQSSSSSISHSLDGHKIANDQFSVMVMEAGIVFHSILLGITLVVAGDSYFVTLFVVIMFHQMFEGIALSSRIAALDTKLSTKLIMAGVYALVTPVGMAIGIGSLKTFNGNDPSTIIAIGTLDSFSAGILIWTGLVELWAHDWIFGSLATASFARTSLAMFSLVAGFILMSVLGKWA